MHQPQPALAKRPQGPRGLGVPLFLLRSCASVEQKGVVGVRLAPTAGLLACGRTTHIAHTRTHRTHALLHSHSLTHPLTHRHRLIKHVAAAPRRRTGVAIVIAPCDDGLGSPSRPPRQESVPHRMSPLLYSVIFCALSCVRQKPRETAALSIPESRVSNPARVLTVVGPTERER